jgi:cytochrome c2
MEFIHDFFANATRLPCPIRDEVYAVMHKAAYALAVLVVSMSAAHADGDAAAGKTVFEAHCGGCHATAAGSNGIGPSLAGVFGRKSGTESGYAYSDALKEAGTTWASNTIDRFLQNPSGDIAGTKMFVNLPDAEDRQNVIAYLHTLGK